MTSYGFYISQLIRFVRESSPVDEFNTRDKVLIAKLLKSGYRYHKLRNFGMVSKYDMGLKTLLLRDDFDFDIVNFPLLMVMFLV